MQGGDDFGTIDDSITHPAQAQTGRLANAGLHRQRVYSGVAGAGTQSTTGYKEGRIAHGT